jgi:hypothetical protein
MSQQSFKDFLASLVSLIGRKSSGPDSDEHIDERIPPTGAEFAPHYAGDERGRWLIAYEAGGWFVYPPNSDHRPKTSGGEVYVLHFLPEEAILFTGT